jgi:hypothetical protein
MQLKSFVKLLGTFALIYSEVARCEPVQIRDTLRLGGPESKDAEARWNADRDKT